jgi:iron complex transport system substrate-binding protein
LKRAAAGLALAALLGGGAWGAPLRVMSISLCTDDLLLELLPTGRITSLTYFARERSNLATWPQAARVAVNYGSAEEVLAQHPDLVLSGTYTTAATRRILKASHFDLLEVPPANDFEQIRQVTRQVARAVGAEAAGEALIAKMDAQLDSLEATRPAHLLRVVAWGEGGSIPGAGTLFDAILRAAGGINIAADASRPYTAFDVEELLVANPDLIAYSSSIEDTPGLNTDLALHPLLLKAFAGRRVSYPPALYSCGVPRSAQAAVALRASLLSVRSAP